MRQNILMPIMIFMTRFYHSSLHYCRFSSFKILLPKTIIVVFFALSALFVTSCEENPTKIGLGILPGNDFVEIQTIDTIKVRSFTMYDDSIRSNTATTAFMGEIYDPYFGTTTAEFVTQIRMASAWDDASFNIDSVKLFIQFNGSLGGTNVTHKMRISEIAEQIYVDSVYYSNREITVGAYEMTDIEIPVLKADTINALVIDLPVSFGLRLTEDTSKLFHSNTKPDFRSYFRGLYFRMYPSTDPLMVSVDITAPTTYESYLNYIVVYMHDDAGASKDAYFVLDAVNINAAFNLFRHDFSTAEAGKRINHINDKNYSDTLSYLQSLNGVYTKLELPGLKDLKANPDFAKVAVNKARITVPVHFDGDIYKASNAPRSLRLRYMTENGIKYDVPDYYMDSYNSFFDGSIDTTKAVSVYNFNISAFVQKYLDDKTGLLKPELEVFQGSGIKNAILKANASKSPVKFDFSYTKF